MAGRVNRGLGLLGAAAAATIMLSTRVAAITSAVDSDTACYYPSIGTGRCDMINNNAECDYDGGDCCECTCVGQDCNLFACVDPEAPCVDDDGVTADIYENCGGYLISIGNGVCNEINNNEECGYDAGDCCECTCEPGEGIGYGDCDVFSCKDPSASCFGEAVPEGDDAVAPTPIPVGMTTGGATSEFFCFVEFIGDGDCDGVNNIADCDYDGGDCCECTCEDGLELSCDYFDNFNCRDPSASCFSEETTSQQDDGTSSTSPTTVGTTGYGATSEFLCFAEYIGDGDCDSVNNRADCDYDGGDCCECTCEDGPVYTCGDISNFNCQDPSTACFGEDTGDDDFFSMSYSFTPEEEDESLPTVDGAVEVGTKTAVAVSATAYDVRPGRTSFEVGCGDAGGDGCAPYLTRDGIASEIESRWSCATQIVPDGGPCHIEYTFAEPQDIVDIQVAFWKGNERIRTLEVKVNGELTQTHESYSGATFNTLDVRATGVDTLMLGSVDLAPDEWISIIEVLIFVTP